MSKFNNGDVTDVLDSFFIVYAIDEDDDEANVQELMQQRSDMSEAVNEWYAKAKAFEKVAGIAYWYFERVNPEYADFSDYEGFYEDIRDEFKKLESGDHNV